MRRGGKVHIAAKRIGVRCKRPSWLVAPMRLATDILAISGLAVLLSLPSLRVVLANPADPKVVSGSATISESGRRLDVYQVTDKTIIDWHEFSIAVDEITRFHQPSADALTLNRVTGSDPSHILGQLQANGRIMLVNPNGILFGAGARVDVAALVATTSDIRNQDFMEGRYAFDTPSANPNAMVVNHGAITVADSGFAALVAPAVRNAGVINAHLGRVTLGAAEAFALDLYGDGLVAFRVGVRETPTIGDGQSVDALVRNDGAIFADGGTVQLEASNIGAIVRNVINVDGIVQANSVERSGGKIILSAVGPGVVGVSGRLSATGDDAGETGGSVKVLGEFVGLFNDANIDASGAEGGGEVLIGGDYQGLGYDRNARRSYVDANAVIHADAVEHGDGGRVIVWSDEATRYYGQLSARGGVLGGDGGFAEISGKDYLVFEGTADLTAAVGLNGTLLLDPTDVEIVTAGGGAAADVDQFADPGALVQIDPGTLDAVGGNVTVQATNDITVTNALALTTAGATLTMQADNNITLNNNVSTNGGAITLSADNDASGLGTLTVAATFAVSSGNQAIAITADDIALNGTLNSGTAATTIQISDGGTIGLGATAGGMTISGAELQNVTATGLTIGNATNGNIAVNGISAANSNNISGTLTLNATKNGSSVAFATGASTFNALTVNADDGITVGVGVTTDTGALILDGDADNAADANDNIALGATLTGAGGVSLDATTGGIDLTAASSLFAVGTAINVNDALDGAFDLVVDGFGGIVNFNGNVGATTGIGDGVGAAITVNNTSTGLLTFNGSVAAASGLVAGANTNLKFLQNVTLGNGDTATSLAGTVTLDGLTFSGFDGLSFGNLTLSTGAASLNSNGGAVNLAGTVNGSQTMTIAAGAGVVTTSGIIGGTTALTGFTVSNSASVTINAATTINGGFGLTATGGVTLSDSVTASGTTTIDADSDKNGVGDITVAATKTLNSGNGALSITANDIVLNGSLNSGSAATTLRVSDGGTIGLGATVGDYTLSGAELQSISAADLTIGDNTNGSITVDGITAANSNNVSGTVTLNATANGTGITFSGGASTFNALTANADDGITLSVAPTTDIGSLTLDGDSDNSADANDKITFTAGMTLTSAGSMTLDATTGGLSGSGGVTLEANNGITLGAGLTTAGTTVINADKDGNGSGDFSGTTLNAGSNALTVTGVAVATGTGLIAGATSLNGAVTGSGLNVVSLTMSGASADVNSTTVNGVTGEAAAKATTMPDAATHKVNGCQKSGCPVPVTADLDSVVIVVEPVTTDTTITGSTSSEGSTTESSSGPPTTETASSDTMSTTGSDSDTITDSSSTDTSGSSDWVSGSFDLLAGDELLSTNFDVKLEGFLTLLQDEGLTGAELQQDLEKLGDSDLASLADELGEILGQYDLVMAAEIPTDAFGGKAAVLIPGLLNFQPVVEDEGDRAQTHRSVAFLPGGFAFFQF